MGRVRGWALIIGRNFSETGTVGGELGGMGGGALVDSRNKNVPSDGKAAGENEQNAIFHVIKNWKFVETSLVFLEELPAPENYRTVVTLRAGL